MGLFNNKENKMSCPNCDSKNTNSERFTEYTNPREPELKLLPISCLCKKCGWGFNIIGTKKIHGVEI